VTLVKVAAARSHARELGAPKAITATAHKLARIIYYLVRTGKAYDETICATNEADNRRRLEAKLRRQARELGFEVIAPNPAALQQTN
jgi:transposase